MGGLVGLLGDVIGVSAQNRMPSRQSQHSGFNGDDFDHLLCQNEQ